MARILRQVTVCRDGMHNGFTDLQLWSGCYMLAYRKGAAHISLDAEAVIAFSTDRQRWREMARVKVPGDNRDPKLFPISPDRIAMTIPSWIGGVPKRDLRQFITFSDDGVNWDKPQRILPDGYWLWRIRKYKDRYYGLVKKISDQPGDLHLEIHTSTDLVNWDKHCDVGAAGQGLDESDIHWLPDGTAWLVARAAGNKSWFASAAAPYTDWQVEEMPQVIHAPIILEHNSRIYVAGRCNMDVEGVGTFPFLARQSLAIWELTEQMVKPVIYIPALCDCAYPGLIHDDEGRVCLSYYSQHAYRMGIVDPPYRLEPEEPFDKAQLLTPADVYFAELELP